jgi:hypothetical protein
MKESIFKKRLIEAMENSKGVKLMFQYPGSPRAIKKSGKILDVEDDGFTMREIKDGKITYSYTFLAEVSEEEIPESEYQDYEEEIPYSVPKEYFGEGILPQEKMMMVKDVRDSKDIEKNGGSNGQQSRNCRTSY